MEIVRATGSRQLSALRLLFGRCSPEEQQQRIGETLRSVERGTLNLSGLWLACENELPIGATLWMWQPDGGALVWPPVLSCGVVEETVAAELLKRVNEDLDADSSVKFGQILLAPEEAQEIPALAEQGYHQQAELFFLGRPLEKPLPDFSVPEDLQLIPFSETPETVARFAKVIEATYQETADCPELNGQRTGREALASHRTSGVFDPRCWVLLHRAGEDLGVVLLNPHPEQQALELTYFGVTPTVRGQGISRPMLKLAFETARTPETAFLFTSVDSANSYANRVYADFGFVELARRLVLFRFTQRPAQK